MTEPPITDHVFRVSHTGLTWITAGRCCYRGTCNRPQEDHITAPDYRARKRAAGAR